MKKHTFYLLITCFTFFYSKAQKPETPSALAVYESIKKLNFLGSVLYIAAHPDDENTRLISYLSNHLNARTAYLSLTRGDGGQNLIGTELRELLGVIRTQELLAARRIDGGEQFFTRANDFGYSKHPDETLNIWNKKEVLSDVVLTIRQFKPDIIINRFDHRTPGSTHGHHTSAAMLSYEAFDMSNKNTAFSNQLEQTDLWQAKRLFFNTNWWFYGSKEKFKKTDKSHLINFDIGTYYPLKGVSNNEVAALARSQHLCQGFGRLLQRGSQQEYIEFLKGIPLKNSKNIFEGIDTRWSRLKGGKAIGDILYHVENNFNFNTPEAHLSELIKAYQLLQNLEKSHWKTQKTKELKSIIEMSLGLYLEASASHFSATPDETVTINIEALNRSKTPIVLEHLELWNGKSIKKNVILKNNISENFKINYHISPQENYSTPYWLNKKGSLGMYTVDNKSLIGKPETPRNVAVNFILKINNIPFSITKPVIHRYSKPDKGELYRPFEIIPEGSVKIPERVIIFDDNKKRNISVVVKSNCDSLEGFVEINHSKNWEVSPKKQKVSITNKGEEHTLIFTVKPPENESEIYLKPILNINNKKYSKKLIDIDYSHIPFQRVLLPSKSKAVRLNIKKKGKNIGYIKGAGDVVPESLQQIGYNVSHIKPENITDKLLSQFDAIVIGIRAYNTNKNLVHKQQLLFDYVKKGGNMVVQYNTSHRLKTDNIAPYSLKLSRDRVTDENAEVRFLNAEHPVLNFPNKITKEDFKGWTQERGLYFPNKWANEFTPILSMNDKGETPKNGSLLIAKYGKGYYVYTGLSFFREFPEGISGAYRLFANILSLGKDTSNIKNNK